MGRDPGEAMDQPSWSTITSKRPEPARPLESVLKTVFSRSSSCLLGSCPPLCVGSLTLRDTGAWGGGRRDETTLRIKMTPMEGLGVDEYVSCNSHSQRRTRDIRRSWKAVKAEMVTRKKQEEQGKSSGSAVLEMRQAFRRDSRRGLRGRRSQSPVPRLRGRSQRGQALQA